ncbi:MAG: (2Fe-2S)-binding protein [Thermomicrobiales bacterium]
MSTTLRIESHPVLGSNELRTTVTITADGREIQALVGEPIAAALLASGILKIRTMPGTAAPRGIFTGVGRSIEELGTVNGESNVPLMSTPVEDGMVIEVQQGLGGWVENA